jgi:hypothetical protein
VPEERWVAVVAVVLEPVVGLWTAEGGRGAERRARREEVVRVEAAEVRPIPLRVSSMGTGVERNSRHGRGEPAHPQVPETAVAVVAAAVAVAQRKQEAVTRTA